jgi:hypothetical protein
MKQGLNTLVSFIYVLYLYLLFICKSFEYSRPLVSLNKKREVIMAIPIIRYELDTTGENPNNKVVGEIRVLSENDLRAVAPSYGAYFTESLVLKDNITQLPLTREIDYFCVELLQEASAAYGKEICYLIVITNQNVTEVKFDYQVLGGLYTRSADKIVDLYEKIKTDDRPIDWLNVLNKPYEYNPTKHLHDLKDVYGFQYLVDSLERIRSAILIGSEQATQELIDWINSRFDAQPVAMKSNWTELNSNLISFIENKPDSLVKIGGITSGTGALTRLANNSWVLTEIKQSDWNQTDTGALDYIKNKPDLLSLQAVSADVSGIVNNTALQELGGVDKLINGVRIGRGGGNLTNNVVLGPNALTANSSGSGIVAIGINSMSGNTVGNDNIGIGKDAGNTITIGNNNIVIGSGAQASDATVSNEITLGNSNTSTFRIPGVNFNIVNGNASIGGSATISNGLTLSNGVVNGVAYLNSSKVLTTGNGLTFDGTTITSTGGSLYLNSTNSDSAMAGNYVRFGTNIGLQSNAANSALVAKMFNGSVFVDALTLDTSGNLALGGATPRILANMSGAQSTRFAIQNSAANGNTRVFLYPNGTGNISAVNGTNNSDPNAANFQAFDLAVIGTTDVRLSSNATGSAAFLPLTFYTNGSEQMRLTSTGLLVGLSSALANGKLQVAGSIGLSGNTQIRQAGNGDGNSLQVLATQFVAGSFNSTSYGYTGGGLVASVSNFDSVVLLDAGRATSTDGRVKVINTVSGNAALSVEKNGVYALYASTTGNVGIGTSTPTQLLDIRSANVSGATGATIRIGSQNHGSAGSGDEFGNLEFFWGDPDAPGVKAKIYAKNVGNVGPGGGGTADLLFATTPIGGTITERMRINSSGNLGLGITPWAWGSSYKAIDVMYGAFANTGEDTVDVAVTQNAFFNGSNWITKYTGASKRYVMSDGGHIWFNGASQTAGNAISFTEAMRLTTAGDFKLGTTGFGTRAVIAGTNTAVNTIVSGSNTGMLFLYDTASTANAGPEILMGCSYDGTNSTVGTAIKSYKVSGTGSGSDQFDHGLIFKTSTFARGGVTERVRIDPSGNLLIGTTTVAGLGVSLMPAGTIILNNSGAPTGYVFQSFRRSGGEIGSITQNGTSGVLYNVTSDYRLKTVIGPVMDTGQRIDALQPVEYTWIANGSRTRGFLAHQFQEVYAGSVTGAKDAVDELGKPVYQVMQAGSAEVIADLVAELQSLRLRVAALEAK